MVAYNERILATSGSSQRRDRAARMLVNLRSSVVRLRATPPPVIPMPPRPSRNVIDGVEYEVVSIDELQARNASAWQSRGGLYG